MSNDSRGKGFLSSKSNLVLIAFIAVSGIFLVAEHRAHVIEWLPFVLLAACPLMHLFHGHGGHGGQGKGEQRKDHEH